MSKAKEKLIEKIEKINDSNFYTIPIPGLFNLLDVYWAADMIQNTILHEWWSDQTSAEACKHKTYMLTF